MEETKNKIVLSHKVLKEKFPFMQLTKASGNSRLYGSGANRLAAVVKKNLPDIVKGLEEMGFTMNKQYDHTTLGKTSKQTGPLQRDGWKEDGTPNIKIAPIVNMFKSFGF